MRIAAGEPVISEVNTLALESNQPRPLSHWISSRHQLQIGKAVSPQNRPLSSADRPFARQGPGLLEGEVLQGLLGSRS